MKKIELFIGNVIRNVVEEVCQEDDDVVLTDVEDVGTLTNVDVDLLQQVSGVVLYGGGEKKKCSSL